MDLKKIKDNLSHDLEEINDNITRIKAGSPLSDSYRDIDNEMEDDYIESEEGFRANTLLDDLTSQKKQLETVIKKIENGTYGTCQLCGNKISEKRLEIVPASLFCMNCQEKLESQPQDFN